MLEFLQDAWSQVIYPFVEASWLTVIILVLFGFALRYSAVVNPYLGLRQSLSKTALDALRHTFNEMGNALRLDSPENQAETISQHLAGVFEHFNAKVNALLNTTMEKVRQHATWTITVFGSDNYKRAWRIAGAVTTAILLGIFILADVIQAAFNLVETTGFSAITNRYLTQYPILDNLPLSIMISSVGTTATLAFILMDLWGITKFIPWEDAPTQGGTSIRDRLKPLVICLICMTITVSSFFAFSRLQILPFNSPAVTELVTILPLLAQVLILIPMFATTVFLSYGVMVVFVIYLLVLGLLQVLLISIRGVFFLLAGLLSAIEPASTPAIGLFLAMFLVVIIILGMMIGLILLIVDSAFFMMEFLFLTIVGVLKWIITRVDRSLTFERP